MVDERRLELTTLCRNGDIFGNCLGLLRLVPPLEARSPQFATLPAAKRTGLGSSDGS